MREGAAPHASGHRAPDDHAARAGCSTLIGTVWAVTSFAIGTSMLSVPFLYIALTAVAVTSSGSVTVRSKLP